VGVDVRDADASHHFSCQRIHVLDARIPEPAFNNRSAALGTNSEKSVPIYHIKVTTSSTFQNMCRRHMKGVAASEKDAGVDLR
jgi:hypothetical protein